MTESTAVYRPSPRPRPAGAPPRPVDERRLHVVPGPSEVPTSGTPEGAPTETITAGQSGSTAGEQAQTSDLGFRVRITTAWASTRTYWTPPALFTAPPASLEDLAAYAKQAPWTTQQTGILRAAGVGYYRFVGYPCTVVSRYGEWVLQRPLRLALHLGALKLFALSGPGDWVVHHIVYPVAHLAGHVFL